MNRKHPTTHETDHVLPEWTEVPVVGILVGLFVLALCLAGAWAFVFWTNYHDAGTALWLVLGVSWFVAAMR